MYPAALRMGISMSYLQALVLVFSSLRSCTIFEGFQWQPGSLLGQCILASQQGYADCGLLGSLWWVVDGLSLASPLVAAEQLKLGLGRDICLCTAYCLGQVCTCCRQLGPGNVLACGL
jgi:hypothetical protein